MAGAAGKLGVTAASTFVTVGANPGWGLDGCPDGLEPSPEASLVAGGADRHVVVLAFHRCAAEVAPSVRRLAPLVHPGGTLWAAWPRRAGGHRSDIVDGTIRAAALPIGLVDTKVAAIDADWSGLKLVWRVSRR